MSYIIKVSQTTQVLVKKDNSKKAKTLIPDEKYIVDDVKNVQVAELKKTACLTVKPASKKDESCFEHLDLA
jgi:hypothetical protein